MSSIRATDGIHIPVCNLSTETQRLPLSCPTPLLTMACLWTYFQVIKRTSNTYMVHNSSAGFRKNTSIFPTGSNRVTIICILPASCKMLCTHGITTSWDHTCPEMEQVPSLNVILSHAVWKDTMAFTICLQDSKLHGSLDTNISNISHTLHLGCVLHSPCEDTVTSFQVFNRLK